MLVLMASAFSAVLPSAELLTVDSSPVNHHPVDPRRRQQRIAEITEMIHVASLLHDDVIDNAETRRGLKALNSAMGNKIAIHRSHRASFASDRAPGLWRDSAGMLPLSN